MILYLFIIIFNFISINLSFNYIIPPNVPPQNIPANPPINVSCNMENYMTYPSTCDNDALNAINNARKLENVKPMILPSNFYNLNAPQQLFVISNLERVDRGLPPMNGLYSPYDTICSNAAAVGTEGEYPPLLKNLSSGSNWIFNFMSPIAACYAWMYTDGYGNYSTNVNCNSPNSSYCWRDRNNILGNWTNGLMGAATGQSSMTMTELFVSYVGSLPTNLSYTWSEVLPYLSPPSSSKTPLIVGVVVGIVGGIALITFIFFIVKIVIYRERKKFLKSGLGLDIPQLEKDAWTIDYKELVIEKELGRGAFGIVYYAKWRGAECVVKQLQLRSNAEALINALKKELDNMKKIRPHPNVVLLLGACTDPSSPICIVTEFVKDGSLFDYIHKESNQITTTMAIKMFKDTACGMAHLHAEDILHCDLAARNLLVSIQGEDNLIIKIADFGLSHSTSDASYYVMGDVKFPIRWSAPEVLNARKFSKAADIWSYGIVMWEIMERKLPYHFMNNQEVAEQVCDKGYRLPKPTKIECPDYIYELMLMCWNADPEKRPSFDEIVGILSSQTKKDELEEPVIDTKPTNGFHQEEVYGYLETETKKQEDDKQENQ